LSWAGVVEVDAGAEDVAEVVAAEADGADAGADVEGAAAGEDEEDGAAEGAVGSGIAAVTIPFSGFLSIYVIA
jgi:hypothetical protein